MNSGPPPAPLRLNAVPEYVLSAYGLKVSTRTVRNWVELGRGNDTLETRQVKNPAARIGEPWMLVTTKEWVDAFIVRSGMKLEKL